MEHEHHLRSLTQQDNGYIGFCAGCGSYNVAYKNMLFVLSESEYTYFRQALKDHLGMRPFFTTHGKEWLLKTPMQNYYLMLTDDEISEIGQMMDDASLLMEVDDILRSSTESSRRKN